MRYLLIAVLVLSGSAFAQEDIDPEIQLLLAKIDSIEAVRNLPKREATVAWADSIAVADTLGVTGVSFVADSRDEQWIMVDVPLSSADGYERSFWLSKLAEAKSEFSAKPSGTVGRVRMRKDRAIDFLKSIKQDLP